MPELKVLPARAWIGFLNDLFYGRSYIAAPTKLSIPVLLDEKSTVVPVRLAGEHSGGKERFLQETLGRTQSERRRRSLFEMSWQCETHGGRKQLQLAVLAFVEKVQFPWISLPNLVKE